MLMLLIEIDVDDYSSAEPGATFDLLSTNRRAIFGPDTATPRTVTATFGDTCSGGTRSRLRGLKVDVVGVN